MDAAGEREVVVMSLERDDGDRGDEQRRERNGGRGGAAAVRVVVVVVVVVVAARRAAVFLAAYSGDVAATRQARLRCSRAISFMSERWLSGHTVR